MPYRTEFKSPSDTNLRRAVVEAERVLDLDDFRADRGVMDVIDADDYVIGEAPAPIAVMTDNGPMLSWRDLR